jgi:hypothetical protein
MSWNRGKSGANGTTNLYSSPEARIAESNRRLVEEQNNGKTSALADSVAQLKFLAVDINQEVKEQNTLLGGMDGSMSSASDMLGDTLGKLGTMLNNTEGKHMLILIVGVVSTFVIFYTVFIKMDAGKDGEGQ